MSLSDMFFGGMHCCSSPALGEETVTEVVVSVDPADETAFDSLACAVPSKLTLPLKPGPLPGLLGKEDRESPEGAQTKTTAAGGEMLSDAEDDPDPCSPSHRLSGRGAGGVALPRPEDPFPLGQDTPASGSPASMCHQPGLHTPTGSQGTPSPVVRERRARRARFARRRANSIESLRSVVDSISRAVSSTLSALAHHGAHTHEDVPALVVPGNRPALVADTVPMMSLAQLQAAVQAPDGGCFGRVLVETLKCRDFTHAAWRQHPSGAHCGSMTYVMPAPEDIPDAVRRLVTIPATITGISKTWFKVSDDGEELILLQHISSKGVVYCDRFRVEYVYTFKPGEAGGLAVSVWAEIVWSKPLPWTHALLTRSLERKVKTETVANFNVFRRVLQEYDNN